ncbi:efflux RND transporter periplasmic adaptor subunit [Aliiruegeria sabulilitoris]|uniref:efflux RND transporter periplasmic adaptor subunit n=1 Tax=Aliiruegeria sabulilitoris TaxID=1510458 RepID=UPI000830DCED|nr:HlyD family efflux transporter periplasmic adaptor subunit [Aliiruegeria sabulilitoris]NDR55949.1 HlyD family efflux transporter periplasmic adaptor subunit [Pseudoruegeria sp. M32A2M]
MQFLRRSLVGLFLFSVTIGILIYAGIVFNDAVQEMLARESRQRPAQERIMPVNSVVIEAGTATPVITAFGQVQSRRILELRAGAGGRIVELHDQFDAGATVEQGTLLARIDPTDALSALEIAQTERAEAEVELRDAERNLVLVGDELVASRAQARLRSQALKRQEDLANRGVGTEAAIETAALAEASANQAVVARQLVEAAAENRVEQARSRLERARIAVADAERRLEDTKVYAAFTGTLAGVDVVEGGLVSQNERLATLIDPTALEVDFRLSTTQYARLLDEAGTLINAPVQATLDVLGLDLQAQGRISRVDALVGEGQTGRLIFARLDSFAGFRPGDFVTVQVREPELTDVAVLPATAVDAASSVLLIGPEKRLSVAEVEVLRRQGDEVIVSVGALGGQRIVAERTPLIGPGVLVRDLTAQAEERLEEGGAKDAGGSKDGSELIALTPERRAALIAAVEGNARMPAEARARVLSQLKQEKVPAGVVERIESRMGG